MLEVVPVVALAGADGVEEELPADRDVPRDLLEHVLALAGEVHEDDRLAGLRVEVLPGAGQLQVLPRHLRDGRRRVAQEVEVVAGRR